MNNSAKSGKLSPKETEKRAQRRFHIMSLIRLAGAISVMLGLLTANGNTGWPLWAGYLLIINGLIDFFVIPPLLAKRWRSPD